MEKTNVFSIRLSDEEMGIVKELAKESSKSVAQYIRDRLFNRNSQLITKKMLEEILANDYGLMKGSESKVRVVPD